MSLHSLILFLLILLGTVIQTNLVDFILNLFVTGLHKQINMFAKCTQNLNDIL